MQQRYTSYVQLSLKENKRIMLRSLLTLILASALKACLQSGDLQIPTLSLISAHSVVSPGERIQFNCSTSQRGLKNVEFRFFRNRLSTNPFDRNTSGVTFSLTVDVSHQDNYSCDYSNDTVCSSRSNTIEIIVVNLQKPNISLKDPKVSKVIRGHSFTVTCSSESQYPGGSFHLFNGSNIIRSQSAVNHSALFIFPDADYSHQGNYSCVYEVNVSSRTFNSTASDQLLITVKASLHPAIAALVSVVLLFAALTAILLVKKRQNHKTGKVRFFTHGAVNMQSNMVDEEDDEDDYVNTKWADDEYVNINIAESDASSDESSGDYVNITAQRNTVDCAQNRY